MKKIIIVMALGIILLTAHSVFAAGMLKHDWINGKVVSVSQTSITIGENAYTVDPKVTAVRHVKRGNSIYEERARYGDVRAGDTVTIRVERSVVIQVIIERYH